MMVVSFVPLVSGVVMFILGLVVRQWVRDYQMPSWRRLGYKQTLKYKELDYFQWKSWYAWRPVRTVGNRVVWLDMIYRKPGNTYIDHDDWTWYYYADEFDVLKEAQ